MISLALSEDKERIFSIDLEMSTSSPEQYSQHFSLLFFPIHAKRDHLIYLQDHKPILLVYTQAGQKWNEKNRSGKRLFQHIPLRSIRLTNYTNWCKLEMKRNHLEKRLKNLGWRLDRHGHKHDIWTYGELEIAVPRHKEINEYTADKILKQAKGGS